jgi:tetratricopeptide (TPR) repeat protein
MLRLRPLSRQIIIIGVLGVAAVGMSGCIDPAQTAVDQLIQAELDKEQGRKEVALARLSSVIEKNPRLALAFESRAQLLSEKGDYAGAAKDWEEAAKLEPYNFRTHYQLGLMYQTLKKFTDAIRAYKKAVEIRPLDTEANMNLAIVYSQNGDPMSGLKYAQAAVSGGQDNAAAHANLGAVYAQLGYSDLAIDEYKRAIELDPKLSGVYLNLANEYLKQGKWDQGRSVLSTAAALANSAAVSERLGYCFYKLGRLDDAQAAYAESIHLTPNYFQAMNGLGVIAMTKALGSKPADVTLAKEALGWWNKSLQVEPNQPAIDKLIKKYGGSGEKTENGAAGANNKPAT